MKVLIVGQGIAGSVLAWSFRQQAHQVLVCEGNLMGAASPVAAGIINPVTGKRYVKTWGLDLLYPVAKTFYQGLEQQFDTKIWHDLAVLRLLRGAEEINNWVLRCGTEGYKTWLSEQSTAGAWASLLRPGFEYGGIRQAARVDFSVLRSVIRTALEADRAFWVHTFAYEEVREQLHLYDAVIFCEGYRAIENPYFPHQAWQLSKGEAMWLKIDAYNTHSIHTLLKRSYLLAPMGEGVFWTGGSYQWAFQNAEPSKAEQKNMLVQVNEMIEAPVSVQAHRAGIRPTVADRRPLLLQSVVEPRVFMFNGLGTKGALLAPYLAQLMVNWVTGKQHPAEDPLLLVKT